MKIALSSMSQHIKTVPKHVATFFTVLVGTTVPVLTFAQSHIMNASGTDVGAATGLGSNDPIDIAAFILNLVLGILAIIAMIIVLYGGFTWMFSGGNEEKVKKAKGILLNGAIGLLIIMAAWGITLFWIEVIEAATK